VRTVSIGLELMPERSAMPQKAETSSKAAPAAPHEVYMTLTSYRIVIRSKKRMALKYSKSTPVSLFVIARIRNEIYEYSL
jgi:hypothetical protein